MVLIKREIPTSCKVLYTKFCTHNQFLFSKKEAFLKEDFFSCLNCQLKRKNWHSMFVNCLWIGKIKKSCWVFNSKPLSILCLCDECMQSKTSWCHNCVYVLSCKHASRSIRVHALCLVTFINQVLKFLLRHLTEKRRKTAMMMMTEKMMMMIKRYTCKLLEF